MFEVIVDSNFKFVLIFSFIYCLLCYLVAIQWYENGYFTVYNIFFDTDPNANLASFAHGWGRHAISHAFLELFSVPIRLIEGIYSNIFVVEKLKFRELIALSIAPIFSSLTLVYIYRTLILLNLEIIDANIFTLIFATSFTNIVFAIVPETFAISCFLISYLIFYFFKNENIKCAGNIIVWFVLAVFLCGITITNICIFYLVFIIHLLKNERLSWFNATKKASSYSISALFFVIAFYELSHFALGYDTGSEGGVKWVARFLISSVSELISHTVNLFSASINGFIGVSPTVTINDYCVHFACNALSFNRNNSDFLFLGCVAIVWILFAFCSKKYVLEKKWENLYLICLLIIAFNFSLHSLFGREMFIYTQHWITPLILLLVPVLQNKRFVSISILLLLVVINVNFLINVEQLVTFV